MPARDLETISIPTLNHSQRILWEIPAQHSRHSQCTSHGFTSGAQFHRQIISFTSPLFTQTGRLPPLRTTIHSQKLRSYRYPTRPIPATHNTNAATAAIAAAKLPTTLTPALDGVIVGLLILPVPVAVDVPFIVLVAFTPSPIASVTFATIGSCTIS